MSTRPTVSESRGSHAKYLLDFEKPIAKMEQEIQRLETSQVQSGRDYSDIIKSIREQLTAERFREFYAGVVTGEVTRYEVDGLHSLNFVAEGALGGGVSRSLCLDNYGKSLASRILDFEIEIPEELASHLRGMT